jgi:recombinational DNA repair protein (RecF pathway)
MSHAVYQTPAIILKTKNMRESNKLVILYTEKFGLIYCITQSIRELKSKMRYHTNLYSLVMVDVVQGRDIWRITGIYEDCSSLTFAGSLWYELIAKFSQLLNRLCSSQEAHPEVWQDLESLYRQHETIKAENQDYFEIIFSVRILFHLGYWDGKEPFLSHHPYSPEYFDYIDEHKKELITLINQRILDTQL